MVKNQSVIETKRVGEADMIQSGSIILPCEDCQHDSWVSPQSQQVMIEAKVLGLDIGFICSHCMPARVAAVQAEGEEFEMQTDATTFLRMTMQEQEEKAEEE